MLQLILDSIDLGDLMSGIIGNWTKLALGAVTLSFDVSTKMLLKICIQLA